MFSTNTNRIAAAWPNYMGQSSEYSQGELKIRTMCTQFQLLAIITTRSLEATQEYSGVMTLWNAGALNKVSTLCIAWQQFMAIILGRVPAWEEIG